MVSISMDKLSGVPVVREKEIDILLNELLKEFNRKIVVLDDDPTGIQTVHSVYVYTDWTKETLTAAFEQDDTMFFVLTNSRGMTVEETMNTHREIARNLAAASAATGKDYIIVSRGDSTLRGHYPLETAILREETECLTGKHFNGEIIYPFFPEGGRYTFGNVHYVQDGDVLIPAGQTEFAKDKSFGYTASDLTRWVEEKSEGTVSAEDVVTISVEELRDCDPNHLAQKVLSVHDFGKIVVNSVSYYDVKAFVAAFCRAVEQGGEYIFRCAAALPKVLGGVSDRPLLTKSELVAEGVTNGGIILIGSHVNKTTAQLEELKRSAYPIHFIEFDQHLVLRETGLEQEVERVIELAERYVGRGETVAVYTRRERLDLDTDDKDKQLEISVRISDAVTSIIGKLMVQPAFIIAKGGITSSDVGVKALRVKRAEVLGQVRPGIPVWKTGEESKFPNMPYIIFPGNVGSEDDLRVVVEMLMK